MLKRKKMEKNGKPSVIVVPEKDGISSAKKSIWHVNKEMLPYKIHFFLFIGGFGASLPYFSAIGLTRYQLTAGNLAAAFTVQQFLVIVMKPSIGYLADYFNRLKAIIIGLTVIQIVFCLFMISIPSVNIQRSMSSQDNMVLNEHYNFHLCNAFQEIDYISSRRPIINDGWKKVSDCFKFAEKNEIERIVVHCSDENHNTSHSIHICYQIFQTSCVDSFTVPPANIKQHNLTDVLIISQSFDSVQNSIVVCFLPKDEMLFQRDSSYSHLKENCRSVLKSDFMDFYIFLYNSSLIQTSCKSGKPNASEATGKKHEDSLSAQNFKTYQFWVFSFVLTCTCICCSAIFTMSDTACYESIQGNDFGRQRLWGAISWGFVAPFAGFLNDYTGSYFASWCLMVLFCSFQIWNVSKMNLAKPDFSQSIFKDLKIVFSSMEFLAFELGALMNGVFTGVIWFYLAWFLLKIGGNKLIIGLVHAVQCFFGEIPFLFYSGWFIKKLGHFNILSLALISSSIRFLFYSYLHDPWWVLPVECLHGITFGLFYPAMTSYAKISSKPGTEATTQSILCSTYEGLGAGIGCLVAGICIDYYGGHFAFFLLSILSVVAASINIMFSILIRCRKGNLRVNKTHDERY